MGVLVINAAAMEAASGQGRAETIEGLVRSDSGAVVVGALVNLTMAPNRELFTASTDSTGQFRIVVPNGTGDYLIHISALGHESFRKRLTRSGNESIFRVEATLPTKVQELATVQVNAPADRPSRGPTFQDETGGAERITDGANANIAPGDRGNLNLAAGSMPGITMTPGGPSVLGLDPSQNQLTMNGLSFGGSSLPREARMRTRVYTSSYDPSRGGFSGAQVDAELEPGGEFSTVNLRIIADPALRYGQATLPYAAEPQTRIDLSAGGTGEFVRDKWYYNHAVQVTHGFAPVTTFENANGDLLTSSGLAADSAARLAQVLSNLGLPLSDRRTHRKNNDVVLLSRIDYKPFETFANYQGKTSWGVLGYANFSRSDDVESSPLSTASRAGETTNIAGMVQALHSAYWGRDYLTETRSALTLTNNDARPGPVFPEGRVHMSSAGNAGEALSTVLFGGSGARHREETAWSWETTTETMFYQRQRSAHRIKLHASSRFEGFRVSSPENGRGAYDYPSIAALEANAPASYSRSLFSDERRAGGWNGALAVGDLWTQSRKLTLLYGLRVEADNYTVGRNEMGDDRVFGASTRHAPSSLELSPRAGFTWIRTGVQRSGSIQSQMATVYYGPRGVLRGGAGRFRSRLPASVFGSATGAGDVNDTDDLTCIGAAVPIPDWNQLLNESPTECLSGSPTLGRRASAIELFDRNYRAPSSWRGNLSWSSVVRGLDYTVEGIYSLNVNQPGRLDLNFSGAPQGSIESETGRPLFAGSASIVESTGAVSPAASRTDGTFSNVISNVSDLRSTSRQLLVSVTPTRIRTSGRLFVRGSYVRSWMRAQSRGFDDITQGDPRTREWARGELNSRHNFTFELGHSWRWASISGYARVSSGLPYTPRVSGDVNGDGVSFNDAAFVFDPDGAESLVTASAMRTLLTNAPDRARRCLERQLGKIASRNSCEGPWSTTTSVVVNAGYELMQKVLGNTPGATASIYFRNPAGGLDRLFHGSNLRGWGSPAVTDPVLLRARSFDPSRSEFAYDVNARFGKRVTSRGGLNAPFGVTLEFSVPLSKPMGQQQLDRWLKPGRGGKGTKMTADALKRRYAATVPNFYRGIIQFSDSLLLVPAQVTALEKEQLVYRARMDSLWSELVVKLIALPDRYDTRLALTMQEKATDDAWELTRLAARRLPEILSPIQIGLLPWPASIFMKMDKPVKGFRFYVSGTPP